MIIWLKRLLKRHHFKIVKYEKFDEDSIYPQTIVHIVGMNPIDFHRDVCRANQYIHNFIETHKKYGVYLVEVLETDDGNKIFHKKFID